MSMSLESTRLLFPGVSNVKRKDLFSTPVDHREYRFITLEENNLKVFLIKNPRAASSSAYMEVLAGSYHEIIPGAAHFLEHMVFQGSEKYPIKSEFQNFVRLHAGEFDGTTYEKRTKFLFHISHEHFKEALDRFSQFFIAPTFNKESCEDEIKVMEEEFQGNIDDDQFRGSHVRKTLMNPLHPESRFDWGNAESLKDLEAVWKEIRELHHQYYKANNMILCLESNLSLEALEALAREFFTEVPSSKNKIPELPTILRYTGKEIAQVVHQSSTSGNDCLTLTFVFTMEKTLELQHALMYISSLLSSSSENSLIDLLKKEGLIEDKSASGNSVEIGVDFLDDLQVEFQLLFPLSENGKEKPQEIINDVLAYIKFLANEGVKEEIFTALQKIDNTSLQLKADILNEKVSDFIENLKELPLDRFFSGAMILETDAFPEHTLRRVLDNLSFKTLQDVWFYESHEWGDGEGLVEPYTGVQYTTQPLTTYFREDTKYINEIIKQYRLPSGNLFLSDDLRLYDKQEKFKLPCLVFNRPGLRVWMSQDWHFNQPLITSQCLLVTHRLRSNLVDYSIGLILTNLLSSELRKRFNYDISLADAGYQVATKTRGLSLGVTSYSDKHSIILMALFESIINSRFNEQDFNRAFRQVTLICENSKTLEISKQISGTVLSTLSLFDYSVEEILAQLQKLEYRTFIQHWENVKRGFTLELFCHGNTRLNDTIELGKKLSGLLVVHRSEQREVQDLKDVKEIKEMKEKQDHKESSRMAEDSEAGDFETNPKTRVVLLPEGTKHKVNIEVSLSTNAALLFLQAKDDSKQNGRLSRFLAKMMEPKFYQKLRDEQKLAYALDVSCLIIDGYPGIAFSIESAKYNSKSLLIGIVNFIQEFANDLNSSKVYVEQFTSLQDSLNNTAKLSFKMPSSMIAYATRFVDKFERGQYEFEEVLENERPYQEISFPLLQEFCLSITQENTCRQLAILADGKLKADTIGKPQEKSQEKSQGLSVSDQKLFNEFRVLQEKDIPQFKRTANFIPCSIESGQLQFSQRYLQSSETTFNPLVFDKRWRKDATTSAHKTVELLVEEIMQTAIKPYSGLK